MVDVYFKVAKSGQITSVSVGDLYGYGFEEEVKRLMRTAKKFKPGLVDGKPSEFSLHIKIKFELIAEIPMTYSQYLKADSLERSSLAFNFGIASFKNEKFERAIKCFTQSIIFNTTDYEAYYNRGLSKGKLADKNGACADWNKAVELGGTDWKNMLRVCK